MSLPQMSLAGAVMILAIIVIRALAIHRLPKSAFMLLWGVAAARLLIPYSLPSSLSVYTLLGRIAPATGGVTGARIGTARNMPAVPYTPIVPSYPAPSSPAVSAGTAATVAVDPWTVVWAIGALACAGFFAVAYCKCRREFQASFPVDNEYVRHWLGEHRIRRAVAIRQSGRISAPLTYGVLRPVILLPKTVDWDDTDTLNYVLTHEYVHIRRFDAVTKLTLTTAVCVHWFNPAVWVMYVLANRDIELSCDEAVVRTFGERAKPAYAMALIRMEERRSGFTPLYSNFSKNAIEERILAIMKGKKTSLAAVIVAAALVAGVTTAFATSAKAGGDVSTEDLDRSLDAVDIYQGTATLTSYVDPRDGKTYYSFDGGETFEPLTDEEFAARFPTPKVEWWTYDEYKAWLENEKVELQDMIGERAWTSGRGEFVWTQEIVDEAIAMYEGILADIGRGMLYSKTIDGEADTSLMMSMNPADIWMNTHEAIATSADFTQYESFGLRWDNSEKVLYWNGERVRYFLDGVDLDGTGAMAIYLEYADAELKGGIDVHTVRERVQNADGSFDPMGPLTGLERYSQAEFDARSFLPPSLSAETYTFSEVTRFSGFAQNTAETRYVSDAVTACIEDGGVAAELGTGFAERFAKYAPFGITYEEAEGASGAGNVYWNGRLVSRFADITPDGGAFTFSSAKGGGITVKTVYDGSGRLAGAEVITA